MMKLFVVAHKHVNFLASGRTFVGVGPNKKIDGISIYDNSGKNISDKNYCFCELTAMYWMRHNVNEDIIGLEHYRRYFVSPFSRKIISKEKIEKILRKKNAIIHKGFYFFPNLEKYYAKHHFASDLIVLENSIKKLYPEYLNDYHLVMSHKYQCSFNMIIATKEVFDKYTDWLLNILFDVAENIDVTKRDKYQQRVFGFLSERMLWLYFYHNKIAVKKLPVKKINDKKL